MSAPNKGDALIVVDVQKDFLPGGAMAVPRANEVVCPLNQAMHVFFSAGLPVVATRDWHPPDHISFIAQGGPWPPHCVAGTEGAEFADGLRLPPAAWIISKAITPEQEAYSGFEGTDLDARLQKEGVFEVYVGGLATDFCVLNTVRDARRLGYGVFFFVDAIRAVNASPEDEKNAIAEMEARGAIPIRVADLGRGGAARVA